MRHSFVWGTLAAALLCATTAHAQLVYSFESDAQGFGANGGGVTVSQDTIGATDGTHSLKTSVVAGATFVGALTGNVDPLIGNPPGVSALSFDLTIAPGGEYTGAGFAVLGVTIFGASQPDHPGGQQFGLQAQSDAFTHLDGKTAGTYPIQISLNATNPLSFATNQTFDQNFGTVGSGPNVLIPTGVEFYINKSNDSAVTVYIDNVRVIGSSVPEPATFGLFSIAAVCGLVARRRRS